MLFLLLLPLIALPLTAQDKPIFFSTSVAVAADRSESTVFHLVNASSKPIAAYNLRCVASAPESKPCLVAVHGTYTAGLGLPKGRPSFRPGERWTQSLKMAAPDATSCTVDLVYFEDGSHWGEDKGRNLEKIQAIRNGMKAP